MIDEIEKKKKICIKVWYKKIIKFNIINGYCILILTIQNVNSVFIFINKLFEYSYKKMINLKYLPEDIINGVLWL